MAVRIQDVEQGSPADKAGLRRGMSLVRINGKMILDGLDYEFYSTSASLKIEASNGGKPFIAEVEKQEYEPLGCVFASYLIDEQHSCKNKCVFCFIDQMPKGMRSSLYFKDDDERLSFLFGNYITLTNLDERELERIIEMRISPVNISVHTTNPELRVAMMKNKHAGEVLGYIPRLVEAEIMLNTQLVLCPGINDGAELRRSIEWLAQFKPMIQSIAAVPVGLTKHRQNLAQIAPYTQVTAAEQLDILLEYGDEFAAEDGVRLVYPADEWFLLANRPIPEEDFYDGYPQLENGIGMWRLTHNEFIDALENAKSDSKERHADIVVGVSAATLFEKLTVALQDKFENTYLHVHVVRNDFFGEGVTVTGLLTGQDIIAQLQGKIKSGLLLMTDTMLRAENDVFLDDITPEQVGEKLGVTVKVVPNGGDNLLEQLLKL